MRRKGPWRLMMLCAVFFLGARLSYATTTEIVRLQGLHQGKLKKLQIEIHCEKSERAFCQKILKIVRQDFPKVLEFFQYVPRDRVHIQLAPAPVQANGSATVFPQNSITLNDYPPLGDSTLQGKGNWARSLLVHEFAHIVSLEMTHGFLHAIRFFLGSSFKLGGVAPRWFIEGTAVVLETLLTRDGRLDDEDVAYALTQSLLNSSSCQKLDCLDQPKHYPFGRTPYWAGGFFLHHLEQQKPGTLRCLVRSNSSRLPFFLNRAFKQCTGLRAEQAFEQFREAFLKEQTKKRPLQAKKLLKGLGKYARLQWEKTMALSERYLAYVVSDREQQYLGLFHWETGYAEFKQFKRRIYSVQTFSASEDIFSVQLSQGGLKQEVHFLDAVTGRVRRSRQIVGEMLFTLEDNQFLVLRYQQSRWKLYLNQGTEYLLHEFPLLMNLGDPHLIRQQGALALGFTLNLTSGYAYGTLPLAELATSDYQKIRKKNFTVLYQGAEFLRYQDSCEDRVVLKEGDKSLVIGHWKNLTRWQGVKAFTQESLKDIAFLKMSPSQVVTRQLRGEKLFSRQKRSCQDFVKSLEKRGVTRQLRRLKYQPETLTGQPADQTKKYPRLVHYLPNYAMLWYTNLNGLDQLQVSTLLADPKQRHQFNLSMAYYPSLSETVPSGNYRFNFGKNFFEASYNRSFFGSSLGRGANEFKSLTGRIGRNWLGNPWSFSSNLFYEQDEREDFISQRESDQVGVAFGLAYRSAYWKSLLQSLSFSLTGWQQKTLGFPGFIGGNTALKGLFRFGRSLFTEFKTSYGKLDKRTFSDGVLYGGGASSTIGDGAVFHEFYGLPLNDAFGNEISTARLEGQWRFANPHHGKGLFPLFTRSWRLIGGGSFLHAERVFLDPTLFRQKSLYGAYGGLSWRGNLFYLVPTQIDLLATQVLNEEDSLGILFLVKTDLFPRSI